MTQITVRMQEMPGFNVMFYKVFCENHQNHIDGLIASDHEWDHAEQRGLMMTLTDAFLERFECGCGEVPEQLQ